jgi:ferredoxin
MPEKIKKVKIDEEKCIGCGACSMYAPDAFGFDDEKSKAVVKEGAENTDPEKVRQAAEYCPVQAIKIEE